MFLVICINSKMFNFRFRFIGRKGSYISFVVQVVSCPEESGRVFLLGWFNWIHKCAEWREEYIPETEWDGGEWMDGRCCWWECWGGRNVVGHFIVLLERKRVSRRWKGRLAGDVPRRGGLVVHLMYSIIFGGDLAVYVFRLLREYCSKARGGSWFTADVETFSIPLDKPFKNRGFWFPALGYPYIIIWNLQW